MEGEAPRPSAPIQSTIQQQYPVMQMPQQPQQIIVQQIPVAPKKKPSRKFKHNIFNVCSSGFCICLGGFMFPGCINATTRSNYDNSSCCFNLCCVSQCAVRNIVREGYNIDGTCVGDIACVVCCAPCNAIQLHSEVSERGPVRQAM